MAKNPIKFYTPYGTQPPRCFFETTGDSMVQVQFQEESEINNILRSHDRNQHIESIHRGNAIYSDFSNITDFTEALEMIQEAKDEFMNIPSDIREKFQNDPGKFYQYASNPDNHDGLVELGLAKKESVAMPTEPATPEPAEPQNSEGQE